MESRLGSASCTEPLPALEWPHNFLNVASSWIPEAGWRVALFWCPCSVTGAQCLGHTSLGQGQLQNWKHEDTSSQPLPLGPRRPPRSAEENASCFSPCPVLTFLYPFPAASPASSPPPLSAPAFPNPESWPQLPIPGLHPHFLFFSNSTTFGYTQKWDLLMADVKKYILTSPRKERINRFTAQHHGFHCLPQASPAGRAFRS